MTWVQKLLARCGRNYIVLHFHDGKSMVRHAYALGESIYAHPHLPETRVELLPKGKVGRGQSYIVGWSPITSKTKQLFDRLTYAEAVEQVEKTGAA